MGQLEDIADADEGGLASEEGLGNLEGTVSNEKKSSKNDGFRSGYIPP